MSECFLKTLKKHLEGSKKAHDKHVKTEGENLKKILEKKLILQIENKPPASILLLNFWKEADSGNQELTEFH